MQIKLLRVLQDKEIRRVGGTKSTKVNVRLICATNENLAARIQEGHFRQDFYYRINVVTLDVPALRERREDIPVLALHFLEKYVEEKGKQLRGFDDRVMKVLMDYDWAENNVRELENEIERAVIFARPGGAIRVVDLSEKLRGATSPVREVENFFTDEGQPLTYEAFEKRYIRFVLSQVGGNKAKAARIMGVPRSTLRGKMRKLELGQD